MAIDKSRIVNRIKCTRRHPKTGERVEGWVIGVAPDGVPIPPAYQEFRKPLFQAHLEATVSTMGLTEEAISAARRTFDEAGTQSRWRAGLDFYVAADPDGKKLLRDEPFRYPASAMREGLMQARFFPDGFPDILPEPDARFPDANVDPTNCQVTKSQDPAVVARWWWTWHHGGFPHWKAVQMRDGSKEDSPLLTRTDPLPED